MKRVVFFVLLVGVLLPPVAFASGEDPSLPLLLYLVVILLAAKLMGHIGVLLGQPAVLGELLAGILLGNLPLLGVQGLAGIDTDPYVDILARIGVVILLFSVGAESTIRDILNVGLSSLLVALLGVAAPFGLGWFVGAWLLPEQSVYTHVFLGATLCATSVGITARVLQNIGKSRDKESRIILGAAVIDDVLGLIILATVSGIILAADQGEKMSLWSQAQIALKAGGFLVFALMLGSFLTPKIFWRAAKLRGPGVLLGVSLAFCFLLSYLAGISGLAPIVGAFAAGLLLESVHFREFGEREIHYLEDALRPIMEFLVPVFFVQMGAKVDIRVFSSTDALWLALALTVAAIAGKQLCSLGVLGKGINRWAVGFGMIPRGEVGLIFASLGATLILGGERIIDNTTYSAVVIMVLVTTLITPPLLKWALAGKPKEEEG
ncbi:MAG TPA: cation:proton antiporter [Candidatus Deferrimicrobiaceae bacterium]|jgi:Kef-type K+ transport system membrane component KefB|nr:cation:proton antiporter [Candidatus Deferrimicrobiaceae bacterium]